MDNNADLEALANLYAHFGQLLSQQGKFGGAAIWYRRALAIRSDWPELHYTLGDALYRQGNLVGAAASYRQAIAQRPGDVAACYNLGFVLEQQGQFDAAIAVYQKTLEYQPEHPKALNNLGCLWVRLGKPEAAIPCFQKAIQVQPDWASLYSNLGQALHTIDLDQAIAAYHRAIQVDPGYPGAYYNLGKLWQQQQQHKLAIPYFQTAIALEPDHAFARSDCIYSYLELGQFEAAIEVLVTELERQAEFIQGYLTAKPIATHSDEFTLAQVACAEFLKTVMALGQALGRSSQCNPELNPALLTQAYQHLAATYRYWGDVQLRYGNAQQAEGYYQKAIALHPQDVTLYEKLDQALALQARVDAQQLRDYIQQQGVFQGTMLGRSQDGCGVGILPATDTAETAISHSMGDRLMPAMSDRLMPTMDDQLMPTMGDLLMLTMDDRLMPTGPIAQVAEDKTISAAKPSPLIIGFFARTQDWLQQTQQDRRYWVPVSLTVQEWPIATPAIEPESSPLPPPVPSRIGLGGATPQSCAGINCGDCLGEIFQALGATHLGQGIHHCGAVSSCVDTHPTAFVAVLPQGRTWTVPQQNSWLICNAIATVTADHYLLADLSRAYPGALPNCRQYHPEQHPIFRQASLPPLTHIAGTVAVLTGLSANVYFHWLVDILPRFFILQKSGIRLEKIDYFLVNSCQQSFQQETLKLLGIPQEKIIESDRSPHIQAARLVVPSFPGALGWVEPWSIQFLRTTFLEPLQRQISHGCNEDSKLSNAKRLYISRQDAKHRRVLNEAEVITYLRGLDFTIVALEQISFTEQVWLFAQAEIIVSLHGSGLTNLIFCQARTKVVELFSPHYVRHYYWLISQILNLEHYYLVGKGFTCYPIRQLMYSHPLTEDLVVPIATLKNLLNYLGYCTSR